MKKIPLLFNTLLNKAKSLVMEELNTDLTNNQSNPDSVLTEPENTNQSQLETQSFPVKKITWLKGITAIFSGLGIGLLLGMLLGLSVSPVVSGVVATLSGLLAVLLGLDEKYLDPLKSLRIGAFGLAAVVGIILALYIRAHDPLSPTLLDKKNEYIKLGLSEPEALALVVKKAQADSVKQLEDNNVLFSSSVNIGDCTILNRAKTTQPIEEIINTFNRAGGTWEEFAKTFETDLPAEIVGKALITMRDCFCGTTSIGTIEMTNLPEIRKLNSDDSVKHIEEVLSSSASEKNWQAIVTKVKENFPDNDNKTLYLSIIKVLSHDKKVK